MEKSKKVLLISGFTIGILGILALVFVGINMFLKNQNEKIVQNEIIVPSPEVIMNKYEKIDDIDNEYTIENALENGDFVIDKENKIYNKDLLEHFIIEILNSGDTSLRISSETTDALLSVLEVNSSGDEIIVIQNNTQLSGDIIKNKYLKADGYTIEDEIITLVDGTQLKSYYLIKMGSEEKIDLFAYIIKNDEEELYDTSDVIEQSGEIFENSGDLIE